jgi:hypothetical protein
MEPATFETIAALTRHYSRELAAGTQLATTMSALCRSDASRIEFWGGELVEPAPKLERLWVVNDEERICVQAAQLDGSLVCCLGYAEVEGHGPVGTAWLIDRQSGAVYDTARSRRSVVGFYGVALRAVELANWTPSQPHAVAEKRVSGFRLSV